MRVRSSIGHRFFGRHRYAFLLAALSVLIFVRPFLLARGFGLGLLDLILMVALLTSVVACAERRFELVIGVVLSAAVLISKRLPQAFDGGASSVVAPSLAAVFFIYVTGLVLRDIFLRTKSVSSDTIAGAISAYLLLGLNWAFFYALFNQLEPGAFSFSGRAAPGAELLDFVGFSFVTLTTLGYGNVVPTSPTADALATSEAMVGQIYLVVMVARLVAVQVQQSSDSA